MLKAKIKQFFDYYLIYVVIAVVLLGIIGYFVKTIVFDRKELELSVLVIDDTNELDIEQMEEDLKEQLGIDSDKQDITFTIFDNTKNGNEAVIMTRLRAKSVDILISGEETFKEYAANGVYENLDEKLPEDMIERIDSKFIDGEEATLDDDGNVIEWGKSLSYGVDISNGILMEKYGSILENPVIGIVVNTEHQNNSVKALDMFCQ